MGGRHRTAVNSDTHPLGRAARRRGRRPRKRMVVVPVALAVLVAGTATAVAATKAFTCLGSGSTVTVAAAPDIAPALDRIAAKYREGVLDGGSRCVEVTVTAREPHQVADTVRGVRPGQSDADLPDVWVPDSSLWLDTVRADRGAAGRLGDATPVAHSPVVIAMIRPLADRLRWQDAKLSWIDLITSVGQSSTSESAIQLGMVDQARSAASTAALVGLRNATTKANAQVVLVGAMRALSYNVATTERSLLDQLPRSPAELADPALKRLHAFPQSEQGVYRYNSTNPAVPLAAIYPADGAPRLDYPLVPVRSEDDGDSRAEAIDSFLRAVRSADGKKILQGQGFRGTDDEGSLALSPVSGLRRQKPPAAYAARSADVRQMMQVWNSVNLNARMLAVIDVSGSMLKVDPGTTSSRMALTRQGAGQGLGLLAPSSEVGLWIFSTKMTPTADHVELVPVGRLGQPVGSTTRRDDLLAKVGGINAKPNGATGLYDTALAAYRKMVAEYNPKALNSVVLFTDGRNEDPGSISLQQLVVELRKLRDPRKPVAMYTIGFGNEVDAAALKAIAEATGGASTVTTNPLGIREVFLRAVADRLCGNKPCAS
jgi:Bacterial extracellular solute-binding protein/von Willebrand factor type A domain